MELVVMGSDALIVEMLLLIVVITLNPITVVGF